MQAKAPQHPRDVAALIEVLDAEKHASPWLQQYLDALERQKDMPQKQANLPTLAKQRGFGIIDALVAVVIFAFGMAALAALYVRMAPQPYQDINVMQVQASANGLFAALSANPSILPVNVTGATNVSQMPQDLQSWFTQTASVLPGLTVSITSGPNATGDSCTPQSCGITLQMSWTQLGATRTQTFNGQVGIS